MHSFIKVVTCFSILPKNKQGTHWHVWLFIAWPFKGDSGREGRKWLSSNIAFIRNNAGIPVEMLSVKEQNFLSTS